MNIDDQKIFCIGFNKTGTTSLHTLFKSCGLESVHNTEWCYYSHVRKGKEYFENQCYSDGEQSNFIQLEKWFPKSLFVLNTRNKKEWLYSRVKHVMRYNENINISTILTNKKYGKMAKDFYSDELGAINKWILERNIYHKQVRSHFKNKNNFIEVDITKTIHWITDLVSFFDRNDIKTNLIQSESTFHSNKRNISKLKNKTLLTKYFNIIDELVK
jgi:hypothetical protein